MVRRSVTPVLGPLNMGQVLALSVAAGMLLLLALNVVATSRRPDVPIDEPAVVDAPDDQAEADGPSWADPTSRPRI